MWGCLFVCLCQLVSGKRLALEARETTPDGTPRGRQRAHWFRVTPWPCACPMKLAPPRLVVSKTSARHWPATQVHWLDSGQQCGLLHPP